MHVHDYVRLWRLCTAITTMAIKHEYGDYARLWCLCKTMATMQPQVLVLRLGLLVVEGELWQYAQIVCAALPYWSPPPRTGGITSLKASVEKTAMEVRRFG
jgi:hypothetical protein